MKSNLVRSFVHILLTDMYYYLSKGNGLDMHSKQHEKSDENSFPMEPFLEMNLPINPGNGTLMVSSLNGVVLLVTFFQCSLQPAQKFMVQHISIPKAENRAKHRKKGQCTHNVFKCMYTTICSMRVDYYELGVNNVRNNIGFLAFYRFSTHHKHCLYVCILDFVMLIDDMGKQKKLVMPLKRI